MILALARWNGDHAMTKDTTKEAAAAAEGLLFDDWFDAIEDRVRARVRGFIETMLEEELCEALSRPRYGRRRSGEDVGRGRAPRASRTDADGHVRQDADRRAARSADGGRRQDARMAERFASRLSAPHPGRRRLDRRGLSFGNQHPPGAAAACRGVRWAGRQGRGQPDLAQGEGRLGCLEWALARRGADRPVDPRRHGRARSARPEGDLGLAARRARRAGGRPEGAAGDQVDGRGKRGGLARAARRSRPARIAEAGAGRRRRRARPRKGAGGAVARHGDPAVHAVHKHRNLLAHAPERLHEEISNDYKDMIYAQTKPEVEARRKAFIRKWRLKCRAVADSLEEAGDKLFTFTRFPPSQWKSIRTSNAIERLHEEFKRRIKTQTVLPCAETAAMMFWALLASGQITMRKVDGWQTLSEKPTDQSIDLAA